MGSLDLAPQAQWEGLSLAELQSEQQEAGSDILLPIVSNP